MTRVALTLLAVTLANGCGGTETRPGRTAEGGGSAVGMSGADGAADAVSTCKSAVSQIAESLFPFVHVVLPLAMKSFDGVGTVGSVNETSLVVNLGAASETLPIAANRLPQLAAIGDTLRVRYSVYNPANPEDVVISLSREDGTLLWFQYDGELDPSLAGQILDGLELSVRADCDDPPDTCQSRNRRLLLDVTLEGRQAELTNGQITSLPLASGDYRFANFFARDKGAPAGTCADSRSGNLLSLQILPASLVP
jgi:hypothetical protein